ncbi:hypothetical protein PQ469_06525 [Mucilaginibacter sp. KACC 22773]|uniref:hypothetical protein n=1 Tax=Mucilaginibacter sp. KACC 22773 TaxID=3025671 RepID=UPI0023664567|nr:hypothetical protein [Mucilaginibacter sp. KACC 22773]WDF79660.1 hypothetical protein PQ469_06525 [Mucilaginibacter sp. KACC 22773]
MADDNKISIDVNINADGQKQLDQYIQAFDNLRSSITNLSKPLNTISNNLNSLSNDLSKFTGSMDKLNAKNQEFINSGDKATNKLADLSGSFATWGNIITLVTETLKGWQIALTGGLAVITAFGPEIIKWVSALLKGKDAIDQAKLSLSSLNKGLSSTDYSNAIENLNQLKIKVDLAKRGMTDKSEVVKEYNKTIGQAIGQVKSLDQVETMLKDNASNYVKTMLFKAAAMSTIKEAAENQILAQKELAKSDEESVDYLTSGLANATGEAEKKMYQHNAAQNRKNAAKPFEEKEKSLLKVAADYMEKAADIEKNSPINKTRAEIEKLKKATDAGVIGSKTFKEIEKLQLKLDMLNGTVRDVTPPEKKDHTDYLSKAEKLRKDSLARQLQTIFDGYGAEAQAENKRYEQELGALRTLLSKKKISQEEFNKVSKQLTAEHNGNLSKLIDKYNREDAAKAEQAQNELIDLQNKGMQEGAEKQKKVLIQQQKENLQQIKKSDDEIIAQQQNLQIQMALAIATGDTKDAGLLAQNISAKEKLLATNAAKRIEIENQTQAELARIDKETTQKEKLKKDQDNIDDDQSKVDNANSPSAKLAVQKKLIWDQAQYEIDAANGNSVKILQIETKRNKAIADLDKQSRKQRQDQEIQIAQQVASAAFSLISNSIKSSSEAKIQALESDKAKELSNTNLTKSQKAAIEAKYKKKENDEKVKAFKAEQKMQIAQAVINGAIAVTKTLSTMALPAAIPFIAADVAMTAMQIATIASQKPPKFARGGQFISDGRGALLPGFSRTDNTNAYLRSGEAVVVSEAMRNPWARNLVSAINVAHGGRDFSAPNPGNGYAIGGIFTDGGNANRYYNQPVNDVKELANTVAYQMINNFPPIYVDVKDVNNQQNILAQTVDRVNL